MSKKSVGYNSLGMEEQSSQWVHCCCLSPERTGDVASVVKIESCRSSLEKLEVIELGDFQSDQVAMFFHCEGIINRELVPEGQK